MAFEVDEDILQDFLVEASEILEQLSEQLVDLEKRPDDKNLLNAIFRGFHTVKGGAGFLSLTELVDVCHGAENLFDMLRNGKRTLSAELMDVILQALDAINVMFAQVQNREEISPASPDLLHDLHELCKPEGQEQLRTASVAAQPEPEPEPAPEPEVIAEVAPVAVNGGGSIDEISADEFERLLDELHGVGKAPTVSAAPVLSGSGDITDDEFEALLDQLHGQGQHGGAPDLAPLQSVQKEVDELIDDDEFERLLDELHGRGQAPQHSLAPAPAPAPEPKAPAPAAPAAPVTPPKAPVAAKPAPAEPTAPARAAPAKQAAPAESSAVQSDTTVRVDTKTLDVIMNMVGELVLVRNRLVSLGIASNDEEMSKAVANLDVVTADLQGAVMKTRMQPIKKVFGRFPRVVRDLARTLKKDIELVMVGEETDLDKNLVEAITERDSLPSMKTLGVTTLISDSGITRYKIITEEWEIYDKKNPPYWAFEKGVYLEKFDSLFHIDASIKADTAYYYEKKKLWELRSNVHIRSQRGDKFDTDLLFWDEKQERVYSDKFIRIEQEDKIITGYGFESNQQMTEYQIYNNTGIFTVEDTAPADSTKAVANSTRTDSIR
jgi:two-component system chemotaxis sensor kinase CheA